jgi:hypothetical protein
MRIAIVTTGSLSRNTSTTLLAFACLCAAVLLTTPAWSDEAPADPTPVPVAQPSPSDTQVAPAAEAAPAGAGPKDNLAAIAAKLADPTANIWALSFNFQGPTTYDGDVNLGNPRVGGNVIFQPVMPFPLYGEGEDQWKLLTRPVIPIIFSQPIPTGFDEFNGIGGLGDIQIPLMLNPTPRMLGKFIFAAGPIFEFPTSTNDALGAQQYAVGPAVVVGYKTKSFTAILFPNYFWGIADRSDRSSSTPTTSKLVLLYGLTFNLPNAWQVGLNPTISYNHKALKNNKWDVPVGIFAAKTIKLGKFPFKIQAGLEYSVVSPDMFGKRANFRLLVTPVIPGLVKKPIFGGG